MGFRKYVEEAKREQEEYDLRFERFSAWTECPRCLKLDLHPIKDMLVKSCRRQCNSCGKVWRQV